MSELLTVVFQLSLMGVAVAVMGSMIREAWVARTPRVGSTYRSRAVITRPGAVRRTRTVSDGRRAWPV